MIPILTTKYHNHLKTINVANNDNNNDINSINNCDSFRGDYTTKQNNNKDNIIITITRDTFMGCTSINNRHGDCGGKTTPQ